MLFRSVYFPNSICGIDFKWNSIAKLEHMLHYSIICSGLRCVLHQAFHISQATQRLNLPVGSWSSYRCHTMKTDRSVHVDQILDLLDLPVIIKGLLYFLPVIVICLFFLKQYWVFHSLLLVLAVSIGKHSAFAYHFQLLGF